MLKILAISFAAIALTACSAMGGGQTSPDSGATQNSTDANKSRNSSATSPGPGPGTGAGSGAGAAGR